MMAEEFTAKVPMLPRLPANAIVSHVDPRFLVEYLGYLESRIDRLEYHLKTFLTLMPNE